MEHCLDVSGQVGVWNCFKFSVFSSVLFQIWKTVWHFLFSQLPGPVFPLTLRFYMCQAAQCCAHDSSSLGLLRYPGVPLLGELHMQVIFFHVVSSLIILGFFLLLFCFLAFGICFFSWPPLVRLLLLVWVLTHHECHEFYSLSANVTGSAILDFFLSIASILDGAGLFCRLFPTVV